MTIIEAFLASPGPRSLRAAGMLVLKGLAMGTADIIPGVSGGTVAFITGIYTDLLRAINSFSAKALRRLLHRDLAGTLAELHLRFLLPLLGGIATAIVSTAQLMNYLLDHHQVPVWSLFFGLIGSSVVVVWRKLGRPGTASWLWLACGAVLGYVIVGLIPVKTPDELWFIFLSGAVAICAMILPGISGAFILLILGKYQYVTGTLNNPFLLHNFVIILVFCAGCATGLSGFSRFLNWLFARFHDATVACMAGFMIGSLRKIWPWKEALATQLVDGKTQVVAEVNVWPTAFNGDFFLAVGLMLAGFLVVMLLEGLTGRGEKGDSKV